MIAELDERAAEERARSLLAKVAAVFETRTFIPHRLFRHGDTQTLGAYLWPRRFRLSDQTGDEERFFEVEPGSQVLASPVRMAAGSSVHPSRWARYRAARSASAALTP